MLKPFQTSNPSSAISSAGTDAWVRMRSVGLKGVKDAWSDLTLPDNVRVYLVAGAQHLGKVDGTPGICQQPRNTLDDRGPVLRAMLLHLVEWVKHGQTPPPSRHPRLGDHSLVTFDAWKAQFPKIPGLNLPTHAYQPPRLDFGSRFHSEGIADIIPPTVGKPFRTLLPAVNADGNETSGIVLPEVAVPLGTYTGWNLRSPQVGAETMLSPLDGMFIAFAKTRAEREKTGDPRPSLEERYPTREEYLSRFKEAAKKLHEGGFLLEEDMTRIVERASAQ